MRSGSPQVYHRLRKIHGHGYYRLHHAWTRNNRCNDSAPAPSPTRNVLPSASFRMLYLLSLLGLPHTHRGIFMNTPVHCSLYLCRSKYAYIPSLGSESMGLGMPLLIIQAKNLCKANPPPSAQQSPYAASAKGY